MYQGDIDYAADAVKELLVGWTIQCALVDRGENEDGDIFGFVATKGDLKRAVWVSCDPEFNSPGWLSIEDAVPKEVM